MRLLPSAPLFLLLPLTAAWVAAPAGWAGNPSKPAMETLSQAPEQPDGAVTRTDQEWRKLLTPEQYRILRQAGTERPNGEVYREFKGQGGGTYYCAGCGAELFRSEHKFDSHCGWPSFYDPGQAQNVKLDTDYHLGYARTEVRCAKCDGHLGHVFYGEGFKTPTDKRYCINGTVLKFVPFAKENERAGEKAPATKDQGPKTKG